MVLSYDYFFWLLIASTILILSLFVFILIMKNKSQIHYIFISNIGLIFIWCIGHIIEIIITIKHGGSINIPFEYIKPFVYMYYFGLCFLPISLYFTGLIFVKTRIKMTLFYKSLILLPAIDYILLVTNDFHNLYFIKYSIINTFAKFGILFNYHTLVSYIFIFVALYYFIWFSIKNSGFFSRQSILIIVGIALPLAVNVVQTLIFLDLPVYFTPIAFSLSIVCFAFAILKFDFLNVVPIALQIIVDLISDSYLVINKNYDIIDFNKTFIDKFKGVVDVKRRDNFLDILKTHSFLKMDADKVIALNNKVIHQKSTEHFEINVVSDNFNRFFTIEITPIFLNDVYSATIILLKDITQSKLDFETIQKNQSIMMEQERLVSLGQLIGGVAHNLRSPIMSISGGIEGVRDLVTEYERSVGDKNVTPKDHKEIADEMKTWLDKMKTHCAYMSDIISAVKGQAAQFSASTFVNFTIDELIKRIDLLMKHELKKTHCVLKVNNEIDSLIELKGEVNSLVQIFDNLIINAIHAYEGKSGDIELTIKKDEKNILFSVSDHGKGISESIKEKLFKQMVTTKGKGGTGLGIYMSYANIKGRFNGDMWFESTAGQGTTFYITIPYLNSFSEKEVN